MAEKHSRIAMPNGSDAASTARPAARLLTACAAEVPRRPFEWLWRPVLSLGNLTLLVGDPDSGKSLVAVDIAARVSRGADWPGGALCWGGDVLLVSAEDDNAKTVRPRLEAAGADLNRIHLFSASDLGKGAQDALLLERDLDALAVWHGLRARTRLLIFDPLAAALGHGCSERKARALLRAYVEFASRHQIAILGIVPFAKPLCGRTLYRSSPALAFAAAARHVYAVGRDPAEPRRRLLARVKNPLSGEEGGFAFTIEAPDGGEPRLRWESAPVALMAEDALLPREDPVTRAQRTEAEIWLLEILAGGPMRAGMLRNLAHLANIGWRTIERAKTRLGVQAIRQERHWEWCLPAASEIDAQQHETCPAGGAEIRDGAPDPAHAV
jgi:putative DNA primase/helicase